MKTNKKISGEQEERECIRIYDKMKKSETEFIPAREAFALIKKERLKKVRK